MSNFDVIVLGLGGMGSATVSHLARRGLRVLGLEQFRLGHHRGSSHGHTRIIRTAYYEHPSYVPLVQRSFGLWKELQARSGRRLLTPCDCLSIGDPECELINGVRAASRLHRLQLSELSPSELASRFPQFRCEPAAMGVLESASGFLNVEACVQAHLEDALTTGQVELRAEEPVLHWSSRASGVEVVTARGTYAAAKLVITAGAWAGQLACDIGVSLKVMRQVQLWFEPFQDATLGQVGTLPMFMMQTKLGAFYGIPNVEGRGVKCAQHYGAPELDDPNAVNWQVTTQDETATRTFLQRHLPSANGRLLNAEVCQYTLSPDRHFILDHVPHHVHVVLACGFSGHGFKFAPVIGEVLADLVCNGHTTHDITLFRLARFQ